MIMETVMVIIESSDSDDEMMMIESYTHDSKITPTLFGFFNSEHRPKVVSTLLLFFMKRSQGMNKEILDKA